MIYEVYRQISRPCPMCDMPWEFVCETESDKEPRDFDWNSIVIPLSGETIAQQGDKGIWYQIYPRYYDENNSR